MEQWRVFGDCYVFFVQTKPTKFRQKSQKNRHLCRVNTNCVALKKMKCLVFDVCGKKANSNGCFFSDMLFSFAQKCRKFPHMNPNKKQVRHLTNSDVVLKYWRRYFCDVRAKKWNKVALFGLLCSFH